MRTSLPLAHLSKRKSGQRGPQKTLTKKPVMLRIDPDVVEHYRSQGHGWQASMNKGLRADAKLPN